MLVIAPTPFFGDRGCHVRIFEEARTLARSGVQTEIVTYPTGNDVPGVTIHRSVRLPWIEARELGPGYARPFLDVGVLVAAARRAKAFKPQIVHAHLHEGIAIATAIRQLFGIPFIADLQGGLTAELIDHEFISPESLVTRHVERVERWLIRRPDALVASSAAGAAWLVAHGASSGRVESLPDGVDLDRFHPGPPPEGLRNSLGLDGKQVVVFLGVLTEYQGVDALLTSVPSVVREVPNAHFLIMGYPNEAEYRAKVRDLRLESSVTLTGRIPYEQARDYLALGSVAVSAKQSLTEANGKLVNYMACGLPIVATDTPVNREILGIFGALCADWGHGSIRERDLSPAPRPGAPQGGRRSHAPPR